MFEPLKRINDICPICEDIKSLSYGKDTETLTINKQKVKVTVKKYFCKDGDHYFYDPADEEKKFQDAYRKYRDIAGLLQPEEIKEIRTQYGLSRKAFARFLGWGEITIQRYETGALQANAHNDILLLLKEQSNFETIYHRRRSQLAEKDVNRIDNLLESKKQAVLSTMRSWINTTHTIPKELKQLQRLKVSDRYNKTTRSSKGELQLVS